VAGIDNRVGMDGTTVSRALRKQGVNLRKRYKR
jgi:hypothetical protein